jgi:hypothetical protein
MVLTNGTNAVYAFPGDGQPTTILLPDGAQAVSATFSQAFGRYIIAAGPKGTTGGIYGAQSTTATKMSLIYPFDGSRQNDEASVVGPTPQGFVYGTSAVEALGCVSQNGQAVCGIANNFSSMGAGPPTAFTTKPTDPSVGYGLFQNQVLRSTFVDQQGHVNVIPIAQDDVAPVQVDGHMYRRAIVANDFCVFYTSSHGVGMVPDLGDKGGAGRVLYSPPTGAHVLGVQVAPRLNVGGQGSEQPMLYFTVFSPMSAGGGLYMMDLPPECGGPTNPTVDAGFGTEDAGQSFPDGGTSTDAGIGPKDASTQFDAGAPACAMIGQTCQLMPCCAGQGVCTDIAVGDGGFSRQCK